MPIRGLVEPGVRESGPLGANETSGIQVRLGTRDGESDAHGRPGVPRRRRRRSGLIGAGIAAGAVAAVLIGAFLVLPILDEGEDAPETQTAGGPTAAPAASLPPTGTPIDVGTADGSKYRIATVTGGFDKRAARSHKPPLKAGLSFVYVDYVLTNPSGRRVLLDFPADVFIRRDLVAPQAQGRCVWQPGVPETMCTPPVKSEIVRRLAGGELEAGDGGDRYLPAGSSYLVRATAEVPVSDRTKRTDLSLYVWKQLYVADQLAKEAPFPD